MNAPRRALPLVAIATAVLLVVACEPAALSVPDSSGGASLAREETSQMVAEPPVASSGNAPRTRAIGEAFGTGSGTATGGRGGIGGGSGTGGGAGGGIGGVGGSGGAFARARVSVSDARRVSAPAPTETGEAEQSPQASTRAATETTSVAQSAMLIRTGHASLEVDTLERAIAAVQEMARRLGGYVANTNLMVGDKQPRRAELELRFPSSRFDEATTALRPLGKVESLVIHTEDVGEEYVDMAARMSNARRLEERLIDLLARRAGKLEEMLSVERELARVREEIERYEGRLRYLRSRASVSTLAVTVHEPAPVFQPRPGPSLIGEAFRDAWRNFVGFLAVLISSLGWLLPLVAIVGGLAWAGRRWLPRPSAPAPTPAPAPRPTPVPEKRDAA